MKILFDQYQRYKNAQLIIDYFRRDKETFRILEVGANEHRNLERFLPGDNILYLDIQLSEEKLNDEQYILGDATNMDFADESFDIVVALDVFEHIPEERRTDFIREINRVAKVGFVIGAPFADEEGYVHRAEERINEAYRVLYGADHPWLIEHIRNGLPKLPEAEKILKEQKTEYKVFSHGDLRIWEQMMYMQIMADYDPNLLRYFHAVSEHYNETIFSKDYVPGSYRKFIVGDKQGRGILLRQNDSSQEEFHYAYLFQMFGELTENRKLSQVLSETTQLMAQEKNKEYYAQIYLDEGSGFSEEQTVKYGLDKQKIIMEYQFSEDRRIKRFRIDPINTKALVKINEFVFYNAKGEKKEIFDEDVMCQTEGISLLGDGFLVCTTEDPQFLVDNSGNIEKICVDMDVACLAGQASRYLIRIGEYYQDEIDRQHGQIVGCEEQINEQQKRINEQQRQIDEQQGQIKNQQDQMNGQRLELLGHCEVLQKEILEKEAALSRMKGEADHYRMMHDAISQSFSWKLTAPARHIGDFFAQHYFRRAIQCIRDNGFSYTVWLFRTGGYAKNVASIDNDTFDDYHGNLFDYFGLAEAEIKRQNGYKFSKAVKFSILVPLYNTPDRFLREMIESVQYQTYENWELCLADGSDKEHVNVRYICKRYASKDSRIKYKKLEENKGISENTNACIDMASGNYISLLDHDDILHPSALFETMRAICEKEADYIYTDEATFDGTNISHIITRHCKPDFSIDNLRANNYICHFSSFKKDLLEKAGRFRSDYDGSQDHDLILRLTEKAQNVCHIPKVLYYWRSHAQSVASDINAKTYAIDAAKRAVQSHLERVGLKAEILSTRAFPTIFRFKYEIKGEPLISIIIPNKDHTEDLNRCLNSIFEKSTYDNYEIIVVENNSVKGETKEYYQQLQEHNKVQVVDFEGAFNFSQIINFGRKFASGKYLLLLNNDTEVISEEWMEELLMYAQRDDVGAVGAKLYYPDDTIQHAGVVLKLGADRTAGHIHYGVNKDNLGYMGKLYYAQDVSAVTAACLMVSEDIFDEVEGFDEDFAVALNDVDFCLKIREKGYLNVFNPYAELYHYESRSRGSDTEGENSVRYKKEARRFKEKWREVLDAGDPYYNPNFSLDRADYYYVGE